VLGCPPAELMTGTPARPDAREAAARQAREEYYAGLRAFAGQQGMLFADSSTGEYVYTPEARRAYDRYLLGQDGDRPADGTGAAPGAVLVLHGPDDDG